MNEYLISIIVPIYNAENYLERCITSLINQTYKSLEIILINDGSTDNSRDICNNYAKKDKRIKILNQKNSGVSFARNKGLDTAQGQYICFVDSDDYISQEFVEKMYKQVSTNKADLAICNINNVSNKGIKSQNSLSYKNNIITKEDYYKNINSFGGFLWNKIFKKNVIGNLRLEEDIYYCEDELFVINYVEKCTRITCLQEPLYFYCTHLNSLSSWKDGWNEKKITIINAKQKSLDILNKYPFSIYKNYYLKYLYTLIDIYYRYSKNMVKRSKLVIMYKKIQHSNEYTLKNKISVFIRFKHFHFYNLIRELFHILND